MEKRSKDGQTVLFEAADEEQAGDFFIDIATPVPSRLSIVSHNLYALYSSDCRFNFMEIASQASVRFHDAYYEFVSDESDRSFWRDGQLLLHPHGPQGRRGRRLIQETHEQMFLDSQRAYGTGLWEHLSEFIRQPNWDESGFILSNV